MPFDGKTYTPTPVVVPMTGRERLRVLADFLDTVPPHKFDIGLYWCRSSACALGWATKIPAFAAAGYRLDADDVPGLNSNGNKAFEDAATFFGISNRQVLTFFGTTPHNPRDITGRQVANNIRSYLAEQEA